MSGQDLESKLWLLIHHQCGSYSFPKGQPLRIMEYPKHKSHSTSYLLLGWI